MGGAVRATHHFLTEQNIRHLIPHGRRALKLVDLFIVNDDKRPIAFRDIVEDKTDYPFYANHRDDGANLLHFHSLTFNPLPNTLSSNSCKYPFRNPHFVSRGFLP